MPATLLIRVGEPMVQSVGNSQTVSGRGYFNYMGLVTEPETVLYIACEMAPSTPGVGTVTNEWALFSAPTAPTYGVAPTLTRLASTASGGVFTSSSVTVRSAALNYAPAINTHLYAGMRVVMGTTQPKLVFATGDMNCGFLLFAAAPGDLTLLTTVATTIVALGSLVNGTQNPAMRLEYV